MARNEREGASGHEALGPSDAFKQNVTRALHDVITSEENIPLLRRFRSGYEYRKEIRQAERAPGSSLNNDDTLTNALRETLANYCPSSRAAESERNSQSPVVDVNEKWIQDLDEATKNATSDDITMRSFAGGLRISGLDPKNIPPSQLNEHIMNAMEIYYDRREEEASLDLW